MSEELSFFIRVVRNGIILGALYFISIWTSTTEICFAEHVKPVIIFAVGYIGMEFVAKYKINTSSIPINKRARLNTLIL